MKHIEVPILNDEYHVDVYWNYTAEQAIKEARIIFKDDTIPDNCFDDNRGRCLSRDNYHPAIFIIIPTSDKHFHATLAHEAVHAIDYIWVDIGEKTGDEIFAHSVGAVVAAVTKKL